MDPRRAAMAISFILSIFRPLFDPSSDEMMRNSSSSPNQLISTSISSRPYLFLKMGAFGWPLNFSKLAVGSTI